MRVRLKSALFKLFSPVSKLFRGRRGFTSREGSVQTKPRFIPEDVLVQIFLILCRDEIFQDTASNTSDISVPPSQLDWVWVRVNEVCRYWQTIATGTPELWSYLNTRTFHSAKQTTRFLLQSKNSNLTVECAVSSSHFGNLKKALKEMRRIRHLSIEIVCSDGENSLTVEIDELLLLLDQPAPRAKSIWLNMSNISTRPLILFPVISPGVFQSLKLYSLSLSTNISFFSGLTCLEIRHCSRFSLSELFRILETSPRLTSLSVISHDVLPSSISKSVYLPYLLNMHIKLTHFSEIYDLLFNFDAPNLSRWVISCQKKLTSNDFARLNILSRLPLRNEYNCVLVSASRPSREHSRITLEYEESQPDASNLKGTIIRFPLHPTDLDMAFRCMVDLFSTHLARVEKVKIRDLKDLFTMESWRTVFRTCSCACDVTAELGLGIENREDGMKCLKALSPNSSTSSGEAHEVLCRKLERLSIYWYGSESSEGQLLSVLEDVLTARLSHGTAIHVLIICSTFLSRHWDLFRRVSHLVLAAAWYNIG